MPVTKIPFLALGVAILLGTCAPAVQAESIYLKNGTHFSGRIVAQDPRTLTLRMPGDAGATMSIAKIAVAVKHGPDPAITAALGVVFPGAGQIYLGEPVKFLYYFLLTSVIAGAGNSLGNTLSPGKPALAIGLGAGPALVPWLLGAADGYRESEIKAEQTRYDIQY